MNVKTPWSVITREVLDNFEWRNDQLADLMDVTPETISTWLLSATPNPYNRAVLQALVEISRLDDKDNHKALLFANFNARGAEETHEYLVRIHGLRGMKRGKSYKQLRKSFDGLRERYRGSQKRYTTLVGNLHRALGRAPEQDTLTDDQLVAELRAAYLGAVNSNENLHDLVEEYDKLKRDYANDREHFELAFEGMRTHAENLESEREQLVADFSVLNERYRNQVASLAYLQEKLEEVQGAEQLQMEATAGLCRLVAHYHDQGAER
jgi:predicted nuclease with TOPRIM domain